MLRHNPKLSAEPSGSFTTPPSNFIEEIWSDSPFLADHLKAKFIGFCKSEGYASANAILKFFSSLDESNTEKFCSYASTWIQQHN